MKKSSRKRNPVLKCFRWVLGIPLVLIVAGFLWLMVGLPGSWVTRFLNPGLPAGVNIEAAGLRYTPGQGFRMSQFELYSAKDRVTPLFQADEVTFNPHFFKRLREKEWSAELEILDGSVETNLGTWADDLLTDQMLQIDHIEGRLALSPDALVFDRFRGSLPNIDLKIGGALAFGKGVGEPDPTLLPRTARVVAEVGNFLKNFQFESSPVMQVNFVPESGAETPWRIELSMHHQGVSKHRGFEFEELKAEAVYMEKVLDLTEFHVRENQTRALKGSATVNFEKEEFEVELQNNLRRFGLEALAPFSLGKMLDGLQLRVEDRCDFDIKVGPSSFAKPGSRIAGTFLVENAFYRDTFFPEISLDLDWDMPRLALGNLQGTLGQGKGKGPFSGVIEFDFGSGFKHVDVKGAFYPDLVISMVGAMAEKYLREWEFRGPAPEFTARFDERKTGEPMQMQIDAKGRELLWRGTAIDHMGCTVLYKDEQLSILNASAHRDRESISGTLVFEPRFTGCTFDLKSNFHLPDVLQLIGPGVAKFGQPYRFRGSSMVEAKGFMDFRSPPAHRFEGKFEFSDLVWRWLQLNTLSGSVRLNDQTLELPDIAATLEGGTLNANFRSEKTFSENGQFALSMRLKNMDLHKVITKATDLEDTPYKGNLSLDLNLTGMLKDGEAKTRSDSFAGSGKMEIREGSLFRIPLLLGLSQILSKLVKGFGYASQSDFTADFQIQDGYIRSKELFLQGNVLSIAGPGSYRFSDRKISADLKIHLLKEGVISDALKLILWPIRKLVEVQLTGTLDHPDWQPKNLPKELFGK